MITLEQLEQILIAKGYTNLRIESQRAELILADKNGQTFTYYPEFCDENSII